MRYLRGTFGGSPVTSVRWGRLKRAINALYSNLSAFIPACRKYIIKFENRIFKTRY